MANILCFMVSSRGKLPVKPTNKIESVDIFKEEENGHLKLPSYQHLFNFFKFTPYLYGQSESQRYKICKKQNKETTS